MSHREHSEIVETSSAKPAVTSRGILNGRQGAWRRRFMVLGPSLMGTVGLITNSKALILIAVLSWIVAAIEATGELLLQKRRDDVFAKAANGTGQQDDPQRVELLRAIAAHEAVRSSQLTSGDIVKLLEPRSARVRKHVASAARTTNTSASTQATTPGT